MTKSCKECGIEKPISEFYLMSNRWYYNRCKNCTSIIRKKARTTKYSRAWFSKKYYKLKGNALRREIQFSLSLNDYISLKGLENCFYCDSIPEIMTIDRVDNSKGYIISNCVACCWSCNRLKSKISIAMCRKILAFTTG